MGIEKANIALDNWKKRIQLSRACRQPAIQSGNPVLGSMDVKALYPNCKFQGTMTAVSKASKVANLEFVGVNKWFLVRFVSILTRGKTDNQHVNRFLRKPKGRTTLNSW